MWFVLFYFHLFSRKIIRATPAKTEFRNVLTFSWRGCGLGWSVVQPKWLQGLWWRRFGGFCGTFSWHLFVLFVTSKTDQRSGVSRLVRCVLNAYNDVLVNPIIARIISMLKTVYRNISEDPSVLESWPPRPAATTQKYPKISLFMIHNSPSFQ